MAKKSNVVVIGGGIVGSSIASFLSKYIDGVTLIERNGIASQASGCNYGMVWIQPRTAGFEISMARRSQEIYDELIQNEFDINIEYEKVGGLTVGFSEAQRIAMQWYCERKQKIGIEVELIDANIVAELEPFLNKEITSAIYCKSDAQLNPYLATMAFVNLAKRRGAEILTETEVYQINAKNGKIKSVTTSQGEILTEIVVNCAGCWSRKIAATVGIDLPVYPQRLQSLVTEPLERLLTRTIQGARDLSLYDAENNPHFALDFDFEISGNTENDLPNVPVEDTIFAFLKPTSAGSIVLGTTNEFVGFNHSISPLGLSAIIKEVVKICPSLMNSKIVRSWAGLIPYTFDSKPVLGNVEELRGLYLATGHPHAFSHAPAVGEIISDLIINGHDEEKQEKYFLGHTSINRFRC